MMCLESQALLPVAANPMFKPFNLDEEDIPLDGCVITITGYSGCERENLSHLAGLLGAHTQELFVRKTKPGKQVSLFKCMARGITSLSHLANYLLPPNSSCLYD